MAKNDHVHLGGKAGRSDAIPTNFFLVILMICHLNLVMIPLLLLKCQGYPTEGPLANEHFVAIPSICNQRSLLSPILEGKRKSWHKTTNGIYFVLLFVKVPLPK